MQAYLRKRLQRLSSQHVPHQRPQPNRVVHGRWLLASCAKPSGTRRRSPGIVRRSENGCAYARAFQVTHPDPLLKQLSREAPPGANFFRNPAPMKRRDVLDEEASLYEGLRRALEGGVKQWYKALVSWGHIDSRAVHGLQRRHSPSKRAKLTQKAANVTNIVITHNSSRSRRRSG